MHVFDHFSSVFSVGCNVTKGLLYFGHTCIWPDLFPRWLCSCYPFVPPPSRRFIWHPFVNSPYFIFGRNLFIILRCSAHIIFRVSTKRVSHSTAFCSGQPCLFCLPRTFPASNATRAFAERRALKFGAISMGKPSNLEMCCTLQLHVSNSVWLALGNLCIFIYTIPPSENACSIKINRRGCNHKNIVMTLNTNFYVASPECVI